MTRSLSLLTEKLINPHNDPRIYWAKEVTFDYSSSHAIRVDYMKFKPVNNTVGGIEKGDFYCYEVKSSVEDFHSKNGHMDAQSHPGGRTRFMRKRMGNA